MGKENVLGILRSDEKKKTKEITTFQFSVDTYLISNGIMETKSFVWFCMVTISISSDQRIN